MNTYEVRGGNGSVISRHRSLDAAVKADMKLQRQVKKTYSENSFLDTSIVRSRDGHRIDADEYWAARDRLGI